METTKAHLRMHLMRIRGNCITSPIDLIKKQNTKNPDLGLDYNWSVIF